MGGALPLAAVPERAVPLSAGLDVWPVGAAADRNADRNAAAERLSAVPASPHRRHPVCSAVSALWRLYPADLPAGAGMGRMGAAGRLRRAGAGVYGAVHGAEDPGLRPESLHPEKPGIPLLVGQLGTAGRRCRAAGGRAVPEFCAGAESVPARGAADGRNQCGGEHPDAGRLCRGAAAPAGGDLENAEHPEETGYAAESGQPRSAGAGSAAGASRRRFGAGRKRSGGV